MSRGDSRRILPAEETSILKRRVMIANCTRQDPAERLHSHASNCSEVDGVAHREWRIILAARCGVAFVLANGRSDHSALGSLAGVDLNCLDQDVLDVLPNRWDLVH